MRFSTHCLVFGAFGVAAHTWLTGAGGPEVLSMLLLTVPLGANATRLLLRRRAPASTAAPAP